MEMLGYLFVFSGILMMIGVYFDIKKWFSIRKYTKTEGKVVRIDTEPWTDEHGRASEIQTPIVMFSLGDGLNRSFGLPTGYSTGHSADYLVGEQVLVVFPPSQPEKAEIFDRKRWIKDFLWNFVFTILTVFLGIVFVLA